MTEEQKVPVRRPELNLKISISGKRYFSDPENRAKRSECIKKAFQEHPEYGKNRSEKQKKYYSDPENRLKCKERMSILKDDPEYRRKISEGVKRAWANRTKSEKDKILSKLTERNRREDVRKKNSITIRKRRMQTREEILRKTFNPCKRAIKNREKRDKFFEERDQYYLMTKKIDNARTYGLITEAEAFIRFFSQRELD
jgi:hypothetical protein